MRLHRAASLGLVVLVVAAAAGGAAWWADRRQGPAAPDLDDPRLIALGQQVYAAQCASCHGADLEGEVPDWRTRKPDGRLPAPPHDETGHTWHHPAGQLFAITKHGIEAFAPEGYESDMPAYDDILGDREIWAVIAYIRSTWPPEVRRAHADLSRRAEAAGGAAQ